MLPRRNPLLEKLPQRVRDVILAIVVIVALMLPELRPILILVVVLAVPIIVGFVTALPVLIPPLRRAGRHNPSARRAELVGFSVLTLLLALIAVLALLPALACIIGVSLPDMTPQTYLLLIGASCLPALACGNFVWRFTASAPAAPAVPE